MQINEKKPYLRLTLDKADELLASGFVGGGMLPKLKLCRCC